MTCRSRSTSAARSAAGSCLFLGSDTFQPDPKQSAQWNRGAYLVNGPSHCAECHSPRNILGRHQIRPAFCRRTQSGRRGLGPQHHADAAEGLVGQGYRISARNRPDPGRRFRRRRDGAGHPQHREAVQRRSRGHGGLSQISVAGRRPEAAGEEGRRTIAIVPWLFLHFLQRCWPEAVANAQRATGRDHGGGTERFTP